MALSASWMPAALGRSRWGVAAATSAHDDCGGCGFVLSHFQQSEHGHPAFGRNSARLKSRRTDSNKVIASQVAQRTGPEARGS
jgi:hypothetical protein